MGRRWAPESTTGTDECISPSVAAGLSLGVLEATGLALEAKGARLRAARLPWAEPPELAVVRSSTLAAVVARRLWRGLVRRMSDR